MNGLVVNVGDDSSITNLATSNPALMAQYEYAIQAAVQYYQNAIANPITVDIGFGWGEVGGDPIDAGASGESSTSPYLTNYSALYNAVSAVDTTSAVQLAAVASLPFADPTGGATFSIATAEANVLGLSATNGSGSVGLDTTTAWSWSQANVDVGSEDAVGTLEHEISEVLGRSATGGIGGQYSLLDMFRYSAFDGGTDDSPGTPVGARDEPFVAGYDANAQSYFSYDGGAITLPFETPADIAVLADVGDWAPSVPNDSFADDPPDGADLVKQTDLQVMNVLGYDVNVAPSCFCAGTRIATPNGGMPVEALSVGDRVLLARGGEASIVWIGHRHINCRRHPAPERVRPIRVAAGVFGPGLPCRNLWLSPDHAVFVDGVLIPIKYLLDNDNIVQMAVTRIEYWHLKLSRHDILLAEDLPAESYLDAGDHTEPASRGRPIASAEHATRTWEQKGCAPLVVTGPRLAAVRRRLGRGNPPPATQAGPF